MRPSSFIKIIQFLFVNKHIECQIGYVFFGKGHILHETSVSNILRTEFMLNAVQIEVDKYIFSIARLRIVVDLLASEARSGGKAVLPRKPSVERWRVLSTAWEKFEKVVSEYSQIMYIFQIGKSQLFYIMRKLCFFILVLPSYCTQIISLIANLHLI